MTLSQFSLVKDIDCFMLKHDGDKQQQYNELIISDIILSCLMRVECSDYFDCSRDTTINVLYAKCDLLVVGLPLF